MTPAQRAAIAAAAAAVALPVIAHWEGKANVGYADRLAGGLPTACYGSTRGVVVGRRYPDAECEARLRADATRHGIQISYCLPERLPLKVRAAFTSTAYNIGATTFCASSISRKAQAGDLAGACAAIDLYNKARPGGVLQVVRGLVRRRADERRLCESGLA